MRMKKPAVVVATAALMTLAACGGGSGNTSSPSDNETLGEGGDAGSFKNADAKAPAAVPADAAQGGTFTVLTNQVPATLDPTRAYYTDSTAILSDLVIRSLTQYAYDEDSNDMQLIPDMATDLGKPSEDNKSWTFTLRDGLKYEDGTPVKAEDVAYAVKRSFAIAELPGRPDVPDDVLPGRRQVQGSVQGQGRLRRCRGQRQRHHHQDASSVHRHGLLRLVPGRSPRSRRPRTTRRPTASTRWRPAPTSSPTTRPGSELKLVKNDQWDPNTDPGRIQAVDGWDFKFGQDTAKLENVIINDQGSAQTTLTYDNVSAVVLPVDLVRQGPSRDRHLAVHLHVVHRHDQDQGARGPSGARLGVPVRGRLEGRR